MKTEQLNWNKFQTGLEKKVGVAVDTMMTRVLNNIGKRKHTLSESDQLKHNFIMGAPKRHNLKSFSAFCSAQ